MEYKQIGYSQKTHGVAGELKIFIEEPYEDLFVDQDRIFLDIKGTKQPFFIESIRGKAEFIVKFEDVNNREAAQLMQSRGLFLPAHEVPDALEAEEPTLEYAGLVGYLLVDEDLGDIGRIEEILEMPQQEMAVLQYKGREALVPLNPQFIRAIDKAAQTVRVALPEGLLDL
ncbi:MAG: 16S rRNA processing protein RimM [Saprospiraceae bacterium]|nr:16S rRNA processing protein RimM [Saprospiraceae bacterium]